MFVLNNNITIGPYYKVLVNDVKISKSIFEYVDKAVIKIPAKGRLKINYVSTNPVYGDAKDIAQEFVEGMAVKIELGYNGSLKTEFVGFVSRVNFTTPVEIECEGYSYQLRNKTLKGTVKKIQLRDLLKMLVLGTDIILNKNIPDFEIQKLVLEGKSGTDILEEIKKTSGNVIRFYFNGKSLWGGLLFFEQKKDVKYRMGWNVIKDGNLKLRQAIHQKVEIHYIGKNADGTKVEVINGQGGVVKKYETHTYTNKAALQKLAEAQQKKMSYDGYEGKITSFLEPYCEPGYRAIVTDNNYPERGGTYIIESVEVSYGISGARRNVGIGERL